MIIIIIYKFNSFFLFGVFFFLSVSEWGQEMLAGLMGAVAWGVAVALVQQ